MGVEELTVIMYIKSKQRIIKAKKTKWKKLSNAKLKFKHWKQFRDESCWLSLLFLFELIFQLFLRIIYFYETNFLS